MKENVTLACEILNLFHIYTYLIQSKNASETCITIGGAKIKHYQLLKKILLNLNSLALLAQLGNIFQYSPSSTGKILDFSAFVLLTGQILENKVSAVNID